MSYINPKLDLVRRSANGDPAPNLAPGDQVAKLIDISKCIGCKACQVACMEWNDLRQEPEEVVGVYDNPSDLNPNTWTLMRFTEYENTAEDRLEWLIRKDGCMHCTDPGCLKACPAPGAIVQYSNGIVDFNSEACIGCGYCVKGCPFNIPRISKADNKAYKCTLCSDRVAEGMGPACAKACPTKAITFGPKSDMIALANERVEDLKERGYAKAGLYDPPGVGGTHVMYVLHHADQPSLYAGLPDQPRISPIIETWKGVTKYAGLLAIGAVTAVGLGHYFTAGPNEVTDHDEDAARKLKEGRNV